MSALERGVYTNERVPILATPSAEQILRINREPSRAVYFSTIEGVMHIPYDLSDPSSSGDLIRTDSPGFLKFCIRPLNARIKEDMRKLTTGTRINTVGIRGTACSLDGPLEYNDFLNSYVGDPIKIIRSLEQILAEGSDTGNKVIQVVVTPLESDNLIKGSPQDYLVFHSRKFRMMREVANLPSRSIFPLLLLYDLRFVVPQSNAVTVPDEEPGKAILRAYILDYPNR